MICHRCGAELPDNALRCSNCGIRVNMYCPECKTLNPFGAVICSNCGFNLLVPCPVCSCMNIYNASECRKCHSPLYIQEIPEQKEDETPALDEADVELVESFSYNNSAFILNETYLSYENVLKKENKDTSPPVEKNNNEDILQMKEISLDDNEEEKNINKIFNVEKKEVFADNSDKETEKEEAVQNKKNLSQNDEKIEQEKENFSVSQENNDLLIKEEDIQTLDEIPEILEEENIDNVTQEENTEEYQDNRKDNTENEDNKQDSEFQTPIQPDAVVKIIELARNSLKKHIIAVNGPEGSGKSAILKQVNNYLSRNGFICLNGSCTPLVQITSFGFFQDAFLRLMGFPPYTKSSEAFIKDFKKSSYAKLFSFLDNNELSLFLNIFYPSQKDNFENILENKEQMFHILEKVLKSFLVNNNLIISIDNFELLDGASYDFIVYMLKKGFFNNRLKLIAAYQENKSIQSYFDLTRQEEKIFETILIKKFTKEELIETVSKSLLLNIEELIDEDYLNELIQKSDGNAVRLEQEIAYLVDSGYISVQDSDILINEENKRETSPISFEELMKLRINALNPGAKNVLFMAAVMGYRFASAILCFAVAMPANKAENMLEYLIQELYIRKVDKYTCEFKSLTLWKLIYQEAKSDLLYKENAERLYGALKPLILSSNLQKLISCTEALSKNEAFLIWQNTASITAKLGDTNLYVIAQKQCLKILEEQDISDSEEIKIQIYEEIGKLLYIKSPKEAVTYMANVLDAEIKDSNVRKIIDISGYFIQSCYLTGNYFGVTEAVDAVIKALNSSQINVSKLDIALIKTRKLKALLNIGNSEQIINLVNEEIIPELQKGLNSKQIETSYKNLISHSWIKTKLLLAKAYAEQGNNIVSRLIIEIKQFLEKNNSLSDIEYYLTQTGIIEALSETITGNINNSNEILNNIACEYKNKNMETSLLAEWNLIHIINRVLSGQRNDLKVDLFELAAFTNNINEHFIKNIIKLILGYVLKEEGNTVKALEIFNEEITYFAKEKVAIGALLSWALIVQISMEMNDDEKALNTAVKSLEIAQSPKINNYFFIIYFQKYISEIYQRKGDLAAAKMYLEKSVTIAKQFDLKYQLIELYIAYAKYMEALMNSKRIYSSENVKTASDLYDKAVTTAKELKLTYMSDKAVRARSEFKTFCQLNSIEL